RDGPHSFANNLLSTYSHEMYESLNSWLNISFDIFGRTGNKHHPEITQNIFNRLREKGMVRREGKYMFLESKRIRPELEKLVLEKGPKWSVEAIGVTKEGLKEWLEDDDWLEDCPIMKDGLDWDPEWGVLLGYISVTAAAMEGWKRWWRPCSNCEVEVQLHQFVGEEQEDHWRIWSHIGLLPATLLAASCPDNRWTILHQLSVTSCVSYLDDTGFFRSLDVGVFGNSAQKRGLSADIFRFCLLHSSLDYYYGDEFFWSDLINAHNELLVDKIAKFIRRVVRAVNSEPYFGTVPRHHRDRLEESLPSVVSKVASERAEKLKDVVHDLLSGYADQLENGELKKGQDQILKLAEVGISFVDWPSDLDKHEHAGVWDVFLGLGINLVCLLAAMLEPYIPTTAAGIFRMLQVERPVGRLQEHWTRVCEGDGPVESWHEIGDWAGVNALFEYIDPAKADVWEANSEGRRKKRAERWRMRGATRSRRSDDSCLFR
ncbi:hypothetical protein B0T21DRAFT_355661, partial [Apiosordaria backusii]